MVCLFFTNDGDTREGNSYFKNISLTTSGGSLPVEPGNLTASAILSSAIKLSWTDHSDNESGFKIERKIGAGGTYEEIGVVGTDITEFNNTGLVSGDSYYYRVRAYNGAGNSPFTDEAMATTPLTTQPVAPANLVARAVSSNQINLEWSDNSDNEDYFIIERMVGSEGTFVEIASVDANVTTFQSQGLAKSNVYTFRVLASNGAGNSDYSKEAFATTLGNLKDGFKADGYTWGLWHFDESSGDSAFCDPFVEGAAVKTIGFSGGVGRKSLPGWMPSPEGSAVNFDGINGYGACNEDWYIDYSADGGGVTMEAWLKPNSVYSGDFTILGARFGKQRSVEIRLSYGRIFIRSGSFSTPFTYGKIPLNEWTHVAAVIVPGPDDESYEDDFAYIFVNGRLEGVTPALTSLWESGTAPFVINEKGLFNGEIDEVRISNVDRYFNYKGVIEEPPSSPSDLTATAASSSTVNIAWNDNSDNENGFLIERRLRAEPDYTVIASLKANLTSYADTGLPASTSFSYRIKAYNYSGSSLYSNEEETTTLLETPENLTATVVSGSQIDLSWTYVAGEEDGFKLERKTGESGMYEEIADISSPGNSYSDTGLQNSTTYFYRVYAYNELVNSQFSNETSAVAVGIRNDIPTVEEFAVNAFPNPFSNSIKIVYTLQETSHIDISLYDMTGRKITCLVNDSQDADTYTISWDTEDESGTRVKNGLYVCKFTVKGQRNTRLAILRLVVIH